MAISQDHISMALFCDFENVALGVRDANYDKFDIKKVLERLLLKGSIVVKKSYCDWERYKGFKAAMHEANFELIEIPHVRQSGKNSADIRLVVDALDLCYTKSHVNTFVIISGDSDFSPLVSKLRENAKHVIGVGVKQSTSDLLIANCDEFIFYDDLVRESQRQARRDGRDNRDGAPQPRRSPEEEKRRREEMDARRAKGVAMAFETYEALVTDRDDGGKIWASVLKEALKRRNPGFNENYYGFKTFGNLLEEAQSQGLLSFGRDEKSGAYVSRGTGARADGAVALPLAETPTDALPAVQPTPSPATSPAASEAPTTGGTSDERRRSRGGRGHRRGRHESAPETSVHAAPESAVEAEPWYEPTEPDEGRPAAAPEPAMKADATDAQPEAGAASSAPRSSRSGRNSRTRAKAPKGADGSTQPTATPEAPVVAAMVEASVKEAPASEAASGQPKRSRPARKTAAKKAPRQKVAGDAAT